MKLLLDLNAFLRNSSYAMHRRWDFKIISTNSI